MKIEIFRGWKLVAGAYRVTILKDRVSVAEGDREFITHDL